MLFGRNVPLSSHSWSFCCLLSLIIDAGNDDELTGDALERFLEDLGLTEASAVDKRYSIIGRIVLGRALQVYAMDSWSKIAFLDGMKSLHLQDIEYVSFALKNRTIDNLPVT